jgi:hypothetical protein
MSHQDLDFGATGMIANHVRRPQAPVQSLTPGSAPDGTAPAPGYRYDARFEGDPMFPRGFVPDTWDGNEIFRQLAYSKPRQRAAAIEAARSPEERAEAERRIAEEAERNRPRTLEERLDAQGRELASAQAELIEVKVRLARLEEGRSAKPASVPRIPRRTGGGEGPQAA